MLFATNDSDGNVIIDIAPEAMEIPWVRDLYVNDKHEGKPFFKKTIKWVFHVYSRDHVFSGLALSERKKNVVEIYFDGKMPRSGMDNIEHNTRVQNFITGYNALTKTITERMVETLDELIEQERRKVASFNSAEEVEIKIPYDFSLELPDMYQKIEGEFVPIKPRVISGERKQKVKRWDATVLADVINKSFKLIENYEATKKKAIRERNDLVKEFDGESWLERYYRMERENKKL